MAADIDEKQINAVTHSAKERVSTSYVVSIVDDIKTEPAVQGKRYPTRIFTPQVATATVKDATADYSAAEYVAGSMLRIDRRS